MSLHQHNPYAQYAPMQHYAPQQPQHQAPQQQQQQQPQQSPTPAPATTVAPNDTYTQHASSSNQNQNQPQTQNQTQSQNQPAPLVAQGDWTKNLVQLAKTAELKKHALTLQLHTAHILSAHSQLEQKNKSLQDIKEQKNRLESERTKLLNCLREVNEDRDKADLAETTINKECADLRAKIQVITDGEYTVAKREVDALRRELGQPPVPNLQQTLEDKNSAYLNERRLNGSSVSTEPVIPTPLSVKRAAAESVTHETPGKRPRGRPKGSKNKKNMTAAMTSNANATGVDAGGE